MIHNTTYPALSRYFQTEQDFADAACCSRVRAIDILKGRKEFTEQEKAAVTRAIMLKDLGISEIFDLDRRFRVDR